MSIELIAVFIQLGIIVGIMACLLDIGCGGITDDDCLSAESVSSAITTQMRL